MTTAPKPTRTIVYPKPANPGPPPVPRPPWWDEDRDGPQR